MGQNGTETGHNLHDNPAPINLIRVCSIGIEGLEVLQKRVVDTFSENAVLPFIAFSKGRALALIRVRVGLFSSRLALAVAGL